jgi:hypothetical protein
VTPDGTGDAPTIQAAIDSAASGDDVVVAPGTYTWTSQGASGHSMVSLRPGLTLRSEAGPQATVLDAEDKGRVILCQGVGSDVRIEGLTIERGLAVGTTTPPFVSWSGAGILADDASTPTIENCIIRRNSALAASPHGGGIRCVNAIVRDCEILENRLGGDGSGCGITAFGRLVISGTTIKGNHAFGDGIASAGGISAVEAEMTDCWIEGNSARGTNDGRGGGASIGYGTITRCVFLNNTAAVDGAFETSAFGGGLKAGECTVTDCIFIGNVARANAAPGAGGAIASTTRHLPLTVRRCTFIGNRATGLAIPPAENIGGIAAVLGSVSECIIAWNEGRPVNSSIATGCSNFFGNTGGDEFRGVEQGGNFSADPEFCAVDPRASLSVVLQADSPCVVGQHPDGAPCGRIGSGDVGCAAVSVQNRTWGEVKELFREK